MGRQTVILKINEKEEARKVAKVDAGSSQKVSFSVTRDIAGTYNVDVNGQSGTFTVKETPSEAVEPTEPAQPTAPTEPTEPSQPVVEPAAEPATVSPTPLVPPVPAQPLNWWLIASLVVGCLVIGVVVWRLVIRSRA